MMKSHNLDTGRKTNSQLMLKVESSLEIKAVQSELSLIRPVTLPRTTAPQFKTVTLDLSQTRLMTLPKV